MRKLMLVVGYVAVVVVAVSADWPQWRGPARDGVASTFTAPTTWPAQLTRRWQITVGLGHASPVVAGNRVIVHSRQANREIVAAYDLTSGKQVWQDGRVFTLGISGIFSAHDLATGKLLWRKIAPPTPPEFGTATSPMVDGASVIAFLGGTGAGALTAMDVATGAVKWRWTGDGPAYTSPIIATFSGMRQLITQSQTRLLGLAAADGRLLWEVPLKTPYEQNSVTPIAFNDVVISAGLGTGWSATPRWRSSSPRRARPHSRK